MMANIITWLVTNAWNHAYIGRQCDLKLDRQRMEAFVRRGYLRSGFYSADSPTVAELVSDSD